MMATDTDEIKKTQAEMGLRYLATGLSVVPAIGKKPDVKRLKPYLDGRQRADGDQIRFWLDGRHDLNIAVVCGKPSGNLVVADFDDASGYSRWAGQYPDLAATAPTVETGRGFHVWTHSDFGRIQKMPYGGEIRGKGIAIVPDSKHDSGRLYRWKNPLIEIPAVDPSVFLSTDGTIQTTQSYTLTHGLCVTTIVDALAVTMPTGYGQREGRLFDLARWLKGIIPNASPDELRDIVRTWHTQALPNIRTKPFDASWQDFVRSWSRVKSPAGRPLWLDVVAVAETLPLPSCGAIYESEPYHRLVKLCLALHQAHGGAHFPLSCRKAAEHCGCCEKTGATMLKTLVFDKVLAIHCTHPPGKRTPTGKRAAHEYRFIGIGGAR